MKKFITKTVIFNFSSTNDSKINIKKSLREVDT